MDRRFAGAFHDGGDDWSSSKGGFRLTRCLDVCQAPKIPSEMEVAPRYKLLTLLTLFILYKLLNTACTLACMPVYIVREGKNAIGMG